MGKKKLSGTFPGSETPPPSEMKLERPAWAGKKRSNFDLKICNHTYKVEWVKGLLEKEDLYGDCESIERKIRLDADLTCEEAQETLIHECAHAVSFALGLELSEQRVTSLGAGLQQMLAPILLKDI